MHISEFITIDLLQKSLLFQQKRLSMKKSIFNVIFLLFCSVVSSAGFAQDLFDKNEPVAFTFLQKIQPGQSVGGYPILNFGNEWSLFHAKTGKPTNSPYLGNVSAADIRDGKLYAMLDMVGNLEVNNAGDWTDEPCKRNDYLWKKGEGFRNINCVTINHHTKFFTAPTGEFQQYLVKFREMKLDIPPTVLRVEFTRYSNSGRRLVYKVTINPEMFGFERDNEPIWGANSWHKSFVEKDPKKVAFIAALSKWAESVRDKMDNGFDKKMDAFSSVPPLSSFLKPVEG